MLDGLIVLDDIEPAGGPYDWSPAQLDRGKPGGSLGSWFNLPWGGPEQVILPGFHTSAESGLRKSQTAGEDMFLALCGLMSSGARTILISRWRTGGQSSMELVREFAQELSHTPAAEAWQRSVQVAADTPIEPEHEPRMKKAATSGEAPKAGHPFFWAGYMLVDSGQASRDQDGALSLPGLGAPKKGIPAQPANPPLRLNPPGQNPSPKAIDPPAAGIDTNPPEPAEPPVKRAKKAKAPLKAPTEKARARQIARRTARVTADTGSLLARKSGKPLRLTASRGDFPSIIPMSIPRRAASCIRAEVQDMRA